MAVSLTTLNGILYSWERKEFRAAVTNGLDGLCTALMTQPEDAAEAVADDLTYLVTVAKSSRCSEDVAMFSKVARALRLLTGRRRNVSQLRDGNVRAIIAVLTTAVSVNNDSAAVDAALALLHAMFVCSENALVCIDAIQPLVRCLGSVRPELQAVASGCVQSLCLVSSLAREDIVNAGGISRLVALLYCADTTAVRAIAALHCATADLNVCRAVREAGGIHPVAILLRAEDNDIVAHAAGTLQNISRDRDSVAVVLSARVVDLMMPVLLSGNCQLQASAIGALLNLHQGDAESRNQLKATLTMTVTAAAIDDVFA
jgi:hypothetical protein